MSKNEVENEILAINWDSLSEEEKSEIAVRQAVYLEITKKAVHTSAVHGTDMRNLLFSMALVILLTLFNTETKNIVVSLLGFQLFFAMLSKLSTFFVGHQLNAIKESYLDFLKKRSDK